MNSYSIVLQTLNEIIVDILMFSFVFFSFFFGFEVLCFIFIAEKDKNKDFKFDVMYFPYLEISTPPPLLSTAL